MRQGSHNLLCSFFIGFVVLGFVIVVVTDECHIPLELLLNELCNGALPASGSARYADDKHFFQIKPPPSRNFYVIFSSIPYIFPAVNAIFYKILQKFHRQILTNIRNFDTMYEHVGGSSKIRVQIKYR